MAVDIERADDLEELANLYKQTGNQEGYLRVLEEMARMQDELEASIQAPTTSALPQGAEESLRGFQQPPPKDAGASFVEPAATVLTGMAAEPVAGLMGIGTLPFRGADEAAQVVNEIRDALTYHPRSEAGKKGLEKIAEILSPITKTLESASESAGDIGYRIAGPAGGAAGYTLPTAILESLGLLGVIKSRGATGVTGISEEIIADLRGQGRSVDDLTPQEVVDLQERTAAQVGEEARKFYTDTEGRARRFESAYGQLSAQARREALAREISKGDQGSIAAELNPDPDILAAAEELGVTIIPSAVSRNIVYRELEQGLKSVPGSQLKAQEVEGISKLAQKADDLITKYAGTTNKIGIGLDLEKDMKSIIGSIERQEKKLYDNLRRIIPAKSPVSADATLSFIRKRADNFGGIDELTALERELLKRLDSASNPTYSRLDELRKRVGAAKRGEGDEIFKSAERGLLKKLESLMIRDQGVAAQEFGAEGLWRTASRITAQRKTIENDMTEMFGKKLQNDLIPKLGLNMQQLAKGKFKGFRDTLQRVPKPYRQQVVVSALNDAFTMGSRKEKQLHLPGFVDWYEGVRRSPEAYVALTENLPKRAVHRLDRIATLARGIRRAKESEITTGRIVAVPQLFDQLETTIGKLYGVGKKVAAAELGTSAAGAPGVGAASTITAAMVKGRTPRSVAADQMLSNPSFRAAIKEAVTGDAAAARASAEHLRKAASYRKWEGTLSPKEAALITSMGFIPWLTQGAPKTNKEEPEK